MTGPRHCKKCGHVHTNPTWDMLEPCPKCGAIYSRVEAIERTQAMRAVESEKMRANKRLPKHIDIDNEDYLNHLRGNSLYPNFRGMVNVQVWLGYFFAAITLLGGLFGMKVSTASGPIAFFIAILIVALTKVYKEVVLMLVDVADATVDIAKNTNKNKEDN